MESLKKSKKLIEEILKNTELPPDVQQNLEDARRALRREIALTSDKLGRIIKVSASELHDHNGKGRAKEMEERKEDASARPVKIDLTEAMKSHGDSVHDAIKEMDRRNARSLAQAPFIVVSNATDGKK